MPGRIKEDPVVKKLHLRVDAVERENPVQFVNLQETHEWLKPLATSMDAMAGVRILLRKDPDLRTLADSKEPAKIIAELAILLNQGLIVYQSKSTGGSGVQGGTATGPVAKSEAEEPAASTPQHLRSSRLGDALGSASIPKIQGKPSAKYGTIEFDPEPIKSEPDPLQSPLPGPGREAVGRTR